MNTGGDLWAPNKARMVGGSCGAVLIPSTTHSSPTLCHIPTSKKNKTKKTPPNLTSSIHSKLSILLLISRCIIKGENGLCSNSWHQLSFYDNLILLGLNCININWWKYRWPPQFIYTKQVLQDTGRAGWLPLSNHCPAVHTDFSVQGRPLSVSMQHLEHVQIEWSCCKHGNHCDKRKT